MAAPSKVILFLRALYTETAGNNKQLTDAFLASFPGDADDQDVLEDDILNPTPGHIVAAEFAGVLKGEGDLESDTAGSRRRRGSRFYRGEGGEGGRGECLLNNSPPPVSMS